MKEKSQNALKAYSRAAGNYKYVKYLKGQMKLKYYQKYLTRQIGKPANWIEFTRRMCKQNHLEAYLESTSEAKSREKEKINKEHLGLTSKIRRADLCFSKTTNGI